MKYKLDENGRAILSEAGNLIIVGEDGKESELDALGLTASLSKVNGESAGRKEKIRGFEEQLKAFEGLDPKAAREALEKVAKIKNNELLDSGKADELIATVKEGYELKLSEALKSNEGLNSQIFKLTVATQFGESEHFSGQNPKTNLSPAMGLDIFGKNFKVENGKAVAYDADNKPIMSKTNPAEYAGTNEAIGILINARPDKANILKGSSGGGDSSTKPAGADPAPKGTFKTQREYEAARAGGS